MNARWNLVLLPPAVVTLVLLFGTQFVFLRAGFYEDLGLGLIGDQLQIDNYVTAFRDSFYLGSLWLTIYLSAIVVACSLLLAYPAAYAIARMRSKWAMLVLAAIVVSSFVTVVIKVLGLIIIFGADGPINSLLNALGITDSPVRIVGTLAGVVIGLMHYVLGFLVLLLFSVIQTIPRSLEEAAQIHGASRCRTMWRVVIPLSLPGIVNGALIVFNLSMGAFVSAVLLGAGRVLTLPVVIEQTIVLQTEYGMGSALSAVLLASVLIINVISVLLVRRMRAARLVVA
ncbi:MAG: ABC transporter permease [Rhodospirillaceae bacterium]|nr:ABC transporter permease [Rhodospirillaceae bacterium]MDE0360876.1 ABC transporter permease [Rhodospirillaceae bacterium]